MAITCIHYDLTDLCNAGCPQCPRTNVDGCKPQDWLAHGHETLESFRRHSPPEFLAELESAYFCGNFGDPAVVPELIEILSYCWEAQPRLKLQIHTNAGPRTPDWWRRLGEAARGRRFKVIAGIDGASDETNRRYRVGTNFDRIIENLSAFIVAGGVAEWQMIVFRHNEHEVAEAERMARHLGFAGFRAFPSNRFGTGGATRYSYRGETFELAPPGRSLAPKSEIRHTIAPAEVRQTEATIVCESIEKSKAFVDFQGYLLPCCYVGRRLYHHLHGPDSARDRQIGALFDGFDMERLNVDRVGFAAARAAYDDFLRHLGPYWDAQKPTICKSVCGKRRPAKIA